MQSTEEFQMDSAVMGLDPLRRRNRPAPARICTMDQLSVVAGLIGRLDDFGHDVVVRGQHTDRIGTGGVAGKLKCLTPAASEVDVAPGAAKARLGHPVRAPEALEHRRLFPNPGQRIVPHIRFG